MTNDIIKNKKLWLPERAYGICLWIMPDGLPLMDADKNVLCAEGFINDENVEAKVLEAVKYWTGDDQGYAAWIPGARKVSDSEREDQQERLSLGYTPDPYEDVLDTYLRRNK